MVLAKVLDGGGLDAYDRLRRPRAQMIIAWAHRIAAAQLSSPLAVRLRNIAVRLLLRSSSARCLARYRTGPRNHPPGGSAAAPFCERQLN